MRVTMPMRFIMIDDLTDGEDMQSGDDCGVEDDGEGFAAVNGGAVEPCAACGCSGMERISSSPLMN
jgi:hypothetical protein